MCKRGQGGRRLQLGACLTIPGAKSYPSHSLFFLSVTRGSMITTLHKNALGGMGCRFWRRSFGGPHPSSFASDGRRRTSRAGGGLPGRRAAPGRRRRRLPGAAGRRLPGRPAAVVPGRRGGFGSRRGGGGFQGGGAWLPDSQQTRVCRFHTALSSYKSIRGGLPRGRAKAVGWRRIRRRRLPGRAGRWLQGVAGASSGAAAFQGGGGFGRRLASRAGGAACGLRGGFQGRRAASAVGRLRGGPAFGLGGGLPGGRAAGGFGGFGGRLGLPGRRWLSRAGRRGFGAGWRIWRQKRASASSKRRVSASNGFRAPAFCGLHLGERRRGGGPALQNESHACAPSVASVFWPGAPRALLYGGKGRFRHTQPDRQAKEPAYLEAWRVGLMCGFACRSFVHPPARPCPHAWKTELREVHLLSREAGRIPNGGRKKRKKKGNKILPLPFVRTGLMSGGNPIGPKQGPGRRAWRGQGRAYTSR